MSIELLEQVAAQRLPHDFADLYLCDGLWVLRTAGLIAAFSVRVPGAQGEPGPRIARVLAITPQGRSLLRRVQAGRPAVAA